MAAHTISLILSPRYFFGHSKYFLEETCCVQTDTEPHIYKSEPRVPFSVFPFH